MNLENVAMLELAARALGDLRDEVVFVGGATVELWISDQAAPEFRPTDDVDVIVEVTTRKAYYDFEERVRQAGFRNDTTSGVICRYEHRATGLLLDVMPTEASILGFINLWHAEAFPHAVEIELPSGTRIHAVPPPYLLATKLEAFASRGGGDLYRSRDFGDVITLIDGREELLEEVAESPAALREYVREQIAQLFGHPDFDAAVEGALPASPETPARVDAVVRPRLRAFAALAHQD
jgi:hypothetical protein